MPSSTGAEATFQTASSLCVKTLGADHPTRAGILKNYSVVLRRLGKKKQSKQMEAQAQRILQASNRVNGIGDTIDISSLQANPPR